MSTKKLGDAGAGSNVTAVVLAPGGGDLDFLDQALLSLAMQSRTVDEVLVMIPGGSTDQLRAAASLLEKQPLLDLAAAEASTTTTTTTDGVLVVRSGPHSVAAVAAPDGAAGGVELIRDAVRLAHGRFMTFLEHSNVLYQHALESLSARALRSNAAAILARSRTATFEMAAPGLPLIARTKETFRAGRTGLMTVIKSTASPLHSCLLGRAEIARSLAIAGGARSVGLHDWLIELASQLPFELCNVAVSEVRRRPAVASPPAILERDWQARMIDTKVALILNLVLGPRAAGSPALRWLARLLVARVVGSKVELP